MDESHPVWDPRSKKSNSCKLHATSESESEHERLIRSIEALGRGPAASYIQLPSLIDLVRIPPKHQEQSTCSTLAGASSRNASSGLDVDMGRFNIFSCICFGTDEEYNEAEKPTKPKPPAAASETATAAMTAARTMRKKKPPRPPLPEIRLRRMPTQDETATYSWIRRPPEDVGAHRRTRSAS